MEPSNRLRKVLYLLALLKIIIPYFLQNNFYEPHRDEFLYLAEGQHLAWGFMEVPPMLSVFAWLTHVFGDGMFWIKLWSSLFGAASFIVAGEIVLSLGGKSFALLLLFLPFIFGVYLRLFFLFQPNSPEVFFWTMISYSIIRFIQTGKNKWLYTFGISIGFGMMSKYSVAFFAVSVLVSILFTKNRTIFLNRHFWYASLIGLIIFLPNLLWQYNRNFPVMHHMQELQRTQLQYVDPSDFLIDQFIMNIPCVFIWLTGLWYVSFSNKSKNYRFVGLAYAFVLILLLIGHGKNYKMNTKKTGALKWEDLKNHPLPQDFADMLGWEEMAKKMSQAYETLDSNEKQHTILFCDNYGMAGAITFYARKYHLPGAYSDNASFLYWLPENMHIDNLLLLTDDKNEMQHDFIKNFSSAILTDSITTPMAREHGDLIILLKGANNAFNQMFKEKIERDKAAFK